MTMETEILINVISEAVSPAAGFYMFHRFETICCLLILDILVNLACLIRILDLFFSMNLSSQIIPNIFISMPLLMKMLDMIGKFL